MASQQQQVEMEQGTIPLRSREAYWRSVFEKYDRDHDGKISFDELKAIVDSREYSNEIPEHVVQKIMVMADRDGSGFLDFKEFIYMIHHPQLQSVFVHLVQRYVQGIVPGRRVPNVIDQIDGLYEEEYSCWPPPIFMILISLIEIALFMYDLLDQGYYTTAGKVANVMIYNPYKRYEVWRYVSYMFVHIGSFHLVVNLLVQILLGVPLEMVHKGWRVLAIYFAGVLAGSLGTSVTDPSVFLAGASGGVYALVTAHIATIIINWAQMEFAVYQLLIFLIITISDLGTAVYNRYVSENSKDSSIGYTAHLCGAIAGLLVGINVLRNLEVKSWEKKLWWISLILYVSLMTMLIVWNVAFPNYFPQPRPSSRF